MPSTCTRARVKRCLKESLFANTESSLILYGFLPVHYSWLIMSGSLVCVKVLPTTYLLTFPSAENAATQGSRAWMLTWQLAHPRPCAIPRRLFHCLRSGGI